MEEDLDFLKEFLKDKDDLYIVYDRFTFDNLFHLLLANGLDHEEALSFILCNCTLSALVFQERIYNKKYKQLSPENVLLDDLAAYKLQLFYDLMQKEEL